jgi:hypothetical protein
MHCDRVSDAPLRITDDARVNGRNRGNSPVQTSNGKAANNRLRMVLAKPFAMDKLAARIKAIVIGR